MGFFRGDVVELRGVELGKEVNMCAGLW